MEEMIKLYMEDWMKDSGIVGLCNILKHSEDNIILNQNSIEITRDNLLNFEEKYFNYFIDKYKDILSINKVISFEEFIIYHEENKFIEFNETSLNSLNNYIGDVIKKYTKSNSYKAAYKLIDSSEDILNLEKQLKKVNLKKKQNIKDIIPEVEMQFKLIKRIIIFMNSNSAYKYIGAKNIIYTIIKNGWDGVCFLNPQTKQKDMYIDYREYFVDPVMDYLEADISKFKYNCFSCDRKMKDLNSPISFMNSTGFDVSKKSSHVWDFQNDVAVCPICKLIYSCVPAGISYLYDKGMFINDNSSIEDLININRKIYKEVYEQNTNEKRMTYRALVNSIQEEFNDKTKYELADIQLIRYEEGKYKFNILSRQSLKVIRDSKEDLNRLINSGFKEINSYFNIYELIIELLLNNQNFFILIQKLLHYKLSQPKNCYYYGFHILRILNINTRYLKEVGYMNNSNNYIVFSANEAAIELRGKYKSKKAVDKLNGISYRLLNSLKTNNINSFMDTVLNCYLYVKSSVPKVIINALKDEEQFKTIGYAFVAGLIEDKNEDVKGGNKDE